MTHSKDPTDPSSAETQINMLDARLSAQELLQRDQAALTGIDKTSTPLAWANKALDVAEALLTLERQQETWQQARPALDIFLQHKHWQEAVETCNVLFQTEQDEAIAALGHGVWLAVSFPIEADTSVAMLHHIVDETPADSDGAAIAAATAKYIAELRTRGDKQESLLFLTGHVLGQVAQGHSHITDQEGFDLWIERLQLNEPAILLPKLAQILEVMVDNRWWFDKERLRQEIPAH